MYNLVLSLFRSVSPSSFHPSSRGLSPRFFSPGVSARSYFSAFDLTQKLLFGTRDSTHARLGVDLLRASEPPSFPVLSPRERPYLPRATHAPSFLCLQGYAFLRREGFSRHFPWCVRRHTSRCTFPLITIRHTHAPHLQARVGRVVPTECATLPVLFYNARAALRLPYARPREELSSQGGAPPLFFTLVILPPTPQTQ